jgi:RNA polymerase sigma factor (sigma-70 family)
LSIAASHLYKSKTGGRMLAGEVLEQLQDKAKLNVAYKSLNNFFYKKAFRFLLCNKLNDEDADDVIQETFIKVFEKIDTLKEDGKFESWLWQILRNNMNEFFRKSNRKNDVMFSVASEDLENLTGDEDVKVSHGQKYDDQQSCIEEKFKLFKEEMPDRHYVINLQKEGVSIEDVSIRIGRSYAATKEFLSQSKKKLIPYFEECKDLETS